ncbi:MAG: DUF3021 domain-containing protein [Saccharofermentanales bacterium]|jgi:hypothetical protein
MKKRLLIRSLIGLVAGAMMAHLFTLLSNQLTKGVWLLCMPGLTEEIGFVGAVILQTVLGALFGAVAFGGICFFDIECWSLLRSSAVHCVTILVSYLTVGLILRWFSPHIIPILIMMAIIVLVYALILLFMYLGWKREMRKMNVLTEEYKKEHAQ